MLNIEDIKLINKALESVSGEEFSKLKVKVSLVCQQIEINEKAQQEIASLQDKIVDLNKEDDSDVEEKEKEIMEI